MTSPKQLYEEVSGGKFQAAYYFFGTEDYRITEAQKFVARQFLRGSRQMATNYRRIDARRTSAKDLITELATLSMLGERQVFAVSDFQTYSPSDITRVLGLLTPAPKDRVVIFSSPSSRTPKKNSSFFGAVTKVAQPVEFRKLSGPEVQAQVKVRLKEAELGIEPDAAHLLAELIAGSRGALIAETDKLINYKQAGETVTVADIHRMVSGCETFSIFELTDIIISGDSKRTLAAIERLLAAGQAPSTLVSLMLQHFLSLYLVKNRRKPLSGREFLTGKFAEQASRFNNARLEDLIIDIADTEAALRQGRFKPEMALEILALTVCSEGRRKDEPDFPGRKHG
ncbi:MAG TPA: DNA polymerase III subunit delta [Candidatus Deferrimicrobium sp.]|nr:DNA polymerase III subunit delta [Candidatus Deferrimicrobium sp.]